ncbi:MAG: helix-turn-helix transcriptional regulator [Chloroflexota bacterium]
MPGRFDHLADTRHRASELRRLVGREIRVARLMSGATVRTAGSAIGRSGAWVSRVERGLVPGVSITDVTTLAGAVGLRVRLSTFPDGPAVFDAGQVALLGRLRTRIGPGWRWQLEVPMPIRGDRRAVDAVISSAGGRCVVEAIVRLVDLQAQWRAIALKARDLGIDRTIVVVAATRANRRTLAGSRDLWEAALPIGTRAGLRALQAGSLPSDDALLLM